MPVHLPKLEEIVEYWDYFNKSDRSQMGPHRCTQLRFPYKQTAGCVSVSLYFPVQPKELSQRPIHNVKANLQKNTKHFFFTAIDTKKKKKIEHQDNLKLCS